MRYDTQQSGIFLTDTLKNIIGKAVTQAGSQNRLAHICGVPQVSICSWLGRVSNRDTQSITWPQWALIRPVLSEMGLLDPTDPDWLLPSEMREVLRHHGIALPEDERTLIQAYRNLSPEGKQTARQVLAGLQATMPRQA